MISPCDDERSTLEALTRRGTRRRPRFSLESQQPRCPICQKIMMVYVSLRGPKFRCGCDEVNGKNGNGH
jgi:hypothetical protein